MNLCIIQARLGSNRFPEKVLADIEGETMIQRVVDRVSKSLKVDKIVVAIPEEDKKRFPQVKGVDVLVLATPGDPNDVLKRYFLISTLFADAWDIVRITGDCPLVCPDLIDRTIDVHQHNKVDFTTNRPFYPDGMDVEVFNINTLYRLMDLNLTREEREHVTLYFHHHPGEFRFMATTSLADYPPDLHLSVDEPDDLEPVRQIYRRFGDNFSLGDIMLSIKPLDKTIA